VLVVKALRLPSGERQTRNVDQTLEWVPKAVIPAGRMGFPVTDVMRVLGKLVRSGDVRTSGAHRPKQGYEILYSLLNPDCTYE